MTQGYPLAIIAYVIGILPFIKNLKTEFPDVNLLWYVYDAGALGIFARVEAYFYSLGIHGPGHGYYPKPSKIVLIVHLDNPEAGKLFVLYYWFRCAKARVFLGVIL